MAIIVVKYPQGHIIDTNNLTAVVSTSSGTALFTRAGHGLATGAYIYIYSNLEQYNGFWYVNVVSSSTFKIREYPTATDVTFVNSGTITYYVSVRTHGWNAVHLPMVYKFKSDAWPINGLDTSRTITTFSSYNGNTYINASGDIKSSGTASSLEQVVLSGTSVDGVYKILNWFSDTNFVINLPYSAGNVLSSGTVQYYYMNYHARVRVYAGLDSSHYWTASKPYTLITEQRLVPDPTGLMVMNVADFVKQQVGVLENNLQQDELPNDLDSFCRIYISVAESYDDSDGYTLSEYVSAYTSYTTEIYAVNTKLQFKNRSSGFMDEYVSGVTSLTRQQFLTPFTRPMLFSGYYFDISYINPDSASGNYLKIDRYTKLNGNYTLVTSTQTTQTDYDQGVYRQALSRVSTEDRIDVTLFSTSYGYALQLSDTITIDVSAPCAMTGIVPLYLTWKNYLGGHDYWLFTAKKVLTVDVETSKTQELNIFQNWEMSYGEFANAIRRQTVRTSRGGYKVTSQFCTKDQLDDLAYIVSSPLVQIVSMATVDGNNIVTQRTILVDSKTLKKYTERDKKFSISFDIAFTDEIGVQQI